MITAAPTENSNLKADYNLGYVWLISIVAAMGGLLFGWDWIGIGGAKPFSHAGRANETDARSRESWLVWRWRSLARTGRFPPAVALL